MHAVDLSSRAIPVPVAVAPAGGRTAAAVVLVAVLAAVVFLVRPGVPAGLVWDEGYYATSTQRYLDGRAQFGTHPPLGLMLLAAGEAALRPNASIDTSRVGDTKHIAGEALPAGYSPVGMRLASGSAAAMGAVVLLMLVLRLAGSLPAALLVANLYLFDNALVAHLRAAHLDAFQLLFSLLALWAWASAVRRPCHARLREAAIGAAGALAILVKLNAAWLLVPAAALVLQRACQRRRGGGSIASAVANAGGTAARMLAAGMMATVAVLALHLAVGQRMPDAATVAGRQDSTFVSGAYRRYLQGDRIAGPAALPDAAGDYARFMAADAAGLGRHDANGSTPWQWLRQKRTINYRWDSDGARTAYVQLVPNPVGWLAALLAPLAVAGLLARRRIERSPGVGASSRWIAGTLLVAWVACFVLHLWIASQRVMYLYHAFSGLLLGFLLVPLGWRLAVERWPWLERRTSCIATMFVAVHLAAFLWWSPLSLHRPLDAAACARRNLPVAVVECRP